MLQAMNRDGNYLTKEVKNGQVKVADNVVKGIIVQAYMEEMKLDQENKTFMDKILSLNNSPCKVKVNKSDILDVDIHLKVLYGVNIRDFALQIIDKTKSTLNAMLGFDLNEIKINIFVDGFIFDKNEPFK